ncbi:glycoside hydrolase [Phlebopus sp. FC_14]|nr:glycoside hydrolase [Phlebopus sp. FC_14]
MPRYAVVYLTGIFHPGRCSHRMAHCVAVLATTTTAATSTSLSASRNVRQTCTTATVTATSTLSAPTATSTKAVGQLPALGYNAYGCVHAFRQILLRIWCSTQPMTSRIMDARYNYINIDDCWAELTRENTTQQIVPDPVKFPIAISGVASQIHSIGLKLDIYSDAGDNTCADIDVSAFTSWGVDYLKYDTIVPAPNNAALDLQPTPVEFSLCIWGRENVLEWGPKVRYSWRVTKDIRPAWDSIISIIIANAAILDYVDFYAHNDVDTMEVDNGNFTIEEERSHFAAWAFMKSPILLGTTLRALNSDQLAIISNANLLAFHQGDEYGTPAKPFQATPDTPVTSPPEYHAGQSKKGTHVFILNTANTTQTKTFNFASVPGIGKAPYRITDMWSNMH